MIIRWFLKRHDGDLHLFDTDGELPLVGSEIVVVDYRGDFPDDQKHTRYRVEQAYTLVSRGKRDLNTFNFAAESSDTKRMEHIFTTLKKDNLKLDAMPLNRNYVTWIKQEGEVTLVEIHDHE